MKIEEAKRNANWCKHQSEMLEALFGYNDQKMIQLNKSRAIAAIDTSLEALQEIREALTMYDVD